MLGHVGKRETSGPDLLGPSPGSIVQVTAPLCLGYLLKAGSGEDEGMPTGKALKTMPGIPQSNKRFCVIHSVERGPGQEWHGSEEYPPLRLSSWFPRGHLG